MVFAIVLFGREFPPVLVGAVIALILFGYVAMSRSSPRGLGVAGHGQMFECKRCGRHFQPEKEERLDNGEVHHFINEKCPQCGWDLEWGDPDKRDHPV